MEIFADRSRDPVLRNQQLRKKHGEAALVEYIRLCGSFFPIVFPPLFRRNTTFPIPDCIIYFRPGEEEGLMYIGPQDLRRLFSNVSRFFSGSSAFELVFHFTAINTKYNVSLPFPHHFLYFFFFKRILKIAVINPNYKNCGTFVGKIASMIIVKRRHQTD